MKLDPVRALSDAWAMGKRERTLLLPIAGLFLFVPQLAQLPLLAPPPAWPESTTQEAIMSWFEGSYSAWASANLPWILLGYLLVLFGSATILALFVDRGRLDVRGALQSSLRLALRYLLASFLIGLPIGLGMYLLVLPGIFLLGRLMLTGPAVMATPRLSAVQAAVRSWQATRGSSLPMAALAAMAMLASVVAPAPFLALVTAMRAAGAVNPVALVLLDIGAALAASAAVLMLLLLEIAAWRQLGRS